MVDDVGRAAKDWPDLNFIIYHSGFKPLMHAPDAELKQFDQTGRIDWVTDLAEIPSKHGVKNVYAELGTTFGSCAVTHPKLAAALVGTVIRGMGADHVIWGTDSVWYGSPQWQIDAMRRIEIPLKMRKQHHFQELGKPDSKVKSAIFAGNAARLFGLEAEAKTKPWADDDLAEAKTSYLAAGGKPSNTFYGFIAKARKELA
jgi:predicted TIM-barrel fold metal-dependent hydrolase